MNGLLICGDVRARAAVDWRLKDVHRWFAVGVRVFVDLVRVRVRGRNAKVSSADRTWTWSFCYWLQLASVGGYFTCGKQANKQQRKGELVHGLYQL